jgi:hypothetical protein
MATSIARPSPASGESPARRRSLLSRAGRAREGLAALYPVDARRGPSPLTVGAGILFVAVTALLSMARQSGPGALNSIWAEDGILFYQSTFHQGFVAQLFAPNNGYLELVPRLLIQVVSWFPVARAAEVIAVIGAVSSSALALLVYHAAAPQIPSRALRLCVAVPAAVIVFGQSEVGNSIVNLQWYLLYAAFWMFLWNPRSRPRRMLAAAVLLCAVGSDPVSTLVLSPLLLARLWARPWRESAWQAAGVAAGVLYQVVSLLRGGLSSRSRPAEVFGPGEVAHWFADDVLGHAFISPAETGLASGTWVIGAALLLLFAVVAWRVGLPRQQWLLAGVCAGYSVLLYFFLTIVGGARTDRYGVVPVLLMIAAAAVLCCCRAKWPIVLLCVLMAANLAANYYGGSDSRAAVPGWSTEVRLGRDACRHPGTANAVLHTAPGGAWEVVVPCSALLGS